jgi:hypothetical protein
VEGVFAPQASDPLASNAQIGELAKVILIRQSKQPVPGVWKLYDFVELKPFT